MTPYLSVIFLAALVVAQSTVMSAAKLGTVKPFLPLLAVVSWSLLIGPLPGAWWAIAAGLLLDLVSPGPMFLYTVPMIVAATVVSIGRARLFPGNPVIPWLLTAVATLAFLVVQRAMIAFSGAVVVWSWESLTRDLVPAVALNLLWLPVLYVPLRYAARRAAGPRIAWER
jgi:rod shape-determining protein MreD